MHTHNSFYQCQVSLKSSLQGTSELWHLPAWHQQHLLQVLDCSGNLHILSVMGCVEVKRTYQLVQTFAHTKGMD